MSNLGRISNELPGRGNIDNCGGGAGSAALSKVQRFVDESPTNWLNPHEASARRGQVRDSGVASKRAGQTGGNTDVGGR
jgi:hypothetical protein